MNRLAASALIAITATAATITTAATLAADRAPATGTAVAFKSRPAQPAPEAPGPTRHAETPTTRPAPTAAPHPTHQAAPQPTPTAKPLVIPHYDMCDADPQPCIDKGHLTEYAGIILAGHNYRGWQFLSRVPSGTVVHVETGPLAGDYRVFGHATTSPGERIPWNLFSADLILQTCEGDSTGYSLAERL